MLSSESEIQWVAEEVNILLHPLFIFCLLYFFEGTLIYCFHITFKHASLFNIFSEAEVLIQEWLFLSQALTQPNRKLDQVGQYVQCIYLNSHNLSWVLFNLIFHFSIYASKPRAPSFYQWVSPWNNKYIYIHMYIFLNTKNYIFFYPSTNVGGWAIVNEFESAKAQLYVCVVCVCVYLKKRYCFFEIYTNTHNIYNKNTQTTTSHNNITQQHHTNLDNNWDGVKIPNEKYLWAIFVAVNFQHAPLALAFSPFTNGRRRWPATRVPTNSRHGPKKHFFGSSVITI